MGQERVTTVDPAVICTRSLTKRYGAIVGVEDLDLEVPPGEVFGYLGPNGAGKTTTIRLLTGLMRPTSGSAAVLGLDVVRDVNRVQAAIGYLPGDFVAYPNLTAAEYLQYLAHLRGLPGLGIASSLADRLELDLSRRIATLSHGNRQKVGLIQAFMHEPRLLVLDEPTSGLDPLMQQQFLALVREVRDAGATVFLSSHVLDEVEHVADRVGMLRRGRLTVVESVETLKARALRRIDLTFADDPPIDALRSLAGVRELVVDDHTAHATVEGSTADLLALAAPHRVIDITSHEADLEEIFLAYYAEQEDQP